MDWLGAIALFPYVNFIDPARKKCMFLYGLILEYVK
jgi:hypothetical protein